MGGTRKGGASAIPDLALLHREISQLFARLAELDRLDRGHEGQWSPPVDVFECRGSLVVSVEVPGVAPESLRVTMADRAVVIAGERREPPRDRGIVGFLCAERPHGRFLRRVPLDAAVDVRQARARLQHGVLTVSLPRVKDRRGRETEIPIERGAAERGAEEPET